MFKPFDQRLHTAGLFRIEFRKPDRNPVKLAVVHAVEAGLVGAWHAESKVPLTPNKGAVRDALPRRYQHAFDGGFWFDTHGNGYSTLRGVRGRVLGSIWATPLFPLLKPQ